MLLWLYCSFFKAFPVDLLGLHGWLLRTSLGGDVQRKIWLLSFCVNIWLALYHGFLCPLSSDASGQVDKEIRLKISGKWYRKCSFVRVIFNWVSKVIRDCIGFALLRSVSGLENSRHLLSQSDTKLKLFLAGPPQEIPERVANYNAEFTSSCPLVDFAT